MDRRSFLHTSSAFTGLSALGMAGCSRRMPAASSSAPPALPFYDAVPPLVPIRADFDRIFRITVCLRPFRAAGPRMEAERVGDQLVVHNPFRMRRVDENPLGSSAVQRPSTLELSVRLR